MGPVDWAGSGRGFSKKEGKKKVKDDLTVMAKTSRILKTVPKERRSLRRDTCRQSPLQRYQRPACGRFL